MPGIDAEKGIRSRGRRRLLTALGFAAAAFAVAACSSTSLEQFSTAEPPPAQPVEAAQGPAAIGNGQIRVGLILPLSAQGNAGVAAQSMKNAAEMALAEFKQPNISLLVQDDGGAPQGAATAAQQAIAQGAEIIVGPLFAQSVTAVGQVARARNIPVLAFSTDASVAPRGGKKQSIQPEREVTRLVDNAE